MEEERDLINNEHKCKFLPNITLPKNITCSTDYKEVIDKSSFILHVTPSKFTRSTFKQYKEYVQNKPIIICSKGFEKDSLKTLDEVILEEMPNAKIGVLSGPSHAEEVCISIPTVLVCASKHQDILKEIQDTFMCDHMRIYTSNDVKGVELGGERETFYGLSGLGDLIVTCLSEHSRNRKAGKLIGQGKSLEETKQEVGMVIESIDNIDVAYELGKIHNIPMPIVETVYKVIYKNLDPKKAVLELMNRDKKYED